MRLDAYSRSLRMPHKQWIYNLVQDARIYRTMGQYAEARYLLDLARAHAAIVIGAGC